MFSIITMAPSMDHKAPKTPMLIQGDDTLDHPESRKLGVIMLSGIVKIA
jgi:hypothetical protein